MASTFCFHRIPGFRLFKYGGEIIRVWYSKRDNTIKRSQFNSSRLDSEFSSIILAGAFPFSLPKEKKTTSFACVFASHGGGTHPGCRLTPTSQLSRERFLFHLLLPPPPRPLPLPSLGPMPKPLPLPLPAPPPRLVSMFPSCVSPAPIPSIALKGHIVSPPHCSSFSWEIISALPSPATLIACGHLLAHAWHPVHFCLFILYSII